ncbi:pentatricopeptide repeat-containing protein At1g06140, mitochondrial-like [Lactuca sativa]|uniref:Pentacotripeptide-repeat region of PRORP domain-containing protein n=1 Tax=Lactuca sativa TaxID=4236 RepID=A0A9R1VCI4_LACSA|nr:pentatricopeptide repeat-containing protein At1g06140, mitochondrial-like [Lactuca sativa]KAJ0202253.1 hypothetical protein LSAT_V11C600330340 [Lactuca sativa]
MGLLSKLYSRCELVNVPQVLKACSFLGFIRPGKEIHCAMKRGMIATDIHSETALLNLYRKCGHIQYAKRVFDSIESKNFSTYNSMISAYGEQGLLDECLSLFHEMKGRVDNKCSDDVLTTIFKHEEFDESSVFEK